MLLQQYDLGGVVPASYRIVDEATGTAVAVDPRWDIDHALHETSQPGFDLRDVFPLPFPCRFLRRTPRIAAPPGSKDPPWFPSAGVPLLRSHVSICRADVSHPNLWAR